jgi:hypothetical protein
LIKKVHANTGSFFNLNFSDDPNIKIDYRRLSVFFLLLLTVAVFLLKFHLLFQIPINQDEFSYLSRVYKYIHGSLSQPLQSFHVHFFQWLPLLGTNEVDQIFGARIVMYLLFLGTCGYLFLIGRHYTDTAGALFSVICYLSLLSTVISAASFRHDSIATFLFLFALYYFLVKEQSTIYNITAGLAMAIAVMFAIKSAIYMTAFAALILIRLLFSRDRRQTIVPICGFFLAFVLGALIINQLHMASLADETAAAQAHVISGAYSTFVTFGSFFPQFKFFKLLFPVDFMIWLFLATGIILNTIDSFQKKNLSLKVSLFALLIPLFSIFFYRNAFPYYYVFIMPTATIFCGYMLWRMTGIPKIKNKILCLVLVVFLAGAVFKNFITAYAVFFASPPKIQRQILDVIHEMFPEPVPYIDGCFMVSSYPDVGFFMSSAGMRGYLKGGKPIMKRILDEKRPLFLLANVPHLNLQSDDAAKSDTYLALMTEDWQTLKSNFIHHWGPIWVVGKHFEFTGEYESQKFSIMVPGVYTLEGNENVVIDGRLTAAGNTVELEAGDHVIGNQASPGSVDLKWGHNLYRPAEKPAADLIFLGPFL